MTLHLAHDLGFAWHHHDGTWAKGYLFCGSSFYEGAGVAEYFSSSHSPEAFRQRVLAANGSFAVVVNRPSMHVAAVDRLRSLPLFYGTQGKNLYLSDDAYWLRDTLGDTNLNERAAAEFLRSGYVVGADTLSPSVKQLQAGEFLTHGDSGVGRTFYYRHLHGDYVDLDEAEHFERLEALSVRVFKRLITSAQGRTLVVPLSGGYDSRYIAAMLKRLDYPHVICYTYGRPSSFEVATSQQVAAHLGFPWHFVEYTPEKWEWYATAPEVASYHRCASNLASLPHVQEFLAVRELQASGAIPEDAIFVPGFSGDLLGGSFVPPEAVTVRGAQSLLNERLPHYLYRRHMYLDNPIPSPLSAQIRAHITETLIDSAPPTVEAFIGAAEAWFTEHKVAKFVVNALRSYEVFGYSWRMPLWDNDLMEHWYHVPLHERCGDKLYDRFLLEQLFAPLDIATRKHVSRPKPWSPLRRYLPPHLFERLKSLYWHTRNLAPSEDFNAFSQLSAHIYAQLRVWGVSATRTPDINQPLALWFLAAERRALAVHQKH